MMAELGNLHTQGIEPMQVTDFSGALKGRHNIYDQLSYVLKEAQISVDLVTSEEGLSRKIRMLKPLIQRAVSRGVKIRVVAPSGNVELTEIMNSFGELVEFRNNPDLRGRFCVVDKKHVVFMLTDDEEVHPSYDMGFWVKSPYFAGTLSKMFDGIWSVESNPDTE
jgi:sugar-specific transcriptional regulator TrmB